MSQDITNRELMVKMNEKFARMDEKMMEMKTFVELHTAVSVSDSINRVLITHTTISLAFIGIVVAILKYGLQ